MKSTATCLGRKAGAPKYGVVLCAPSWRFASVSIAGVLLVGLFSGLPRQARAVQINNLVDIGNGISEFAGPGGTALTLPDTSDSGFTPATGPTTNLGSFNIVIVPGAGLASNAPALGAFNRAANQWKARISDPIIVTINANMASLGAGVIGSTSSVLLQAPFNTIRNAMVSDAAIDVDDGIVASLPTAAGFSATLPGGFSMNGNMTASKANLKALGFGGLDGSFGVSDASMTFNSGFAFDYDNSNGVTPGTIDFETVAAHEIGHALGFISVVDTVDRLRGASQTSSSIQPFPLDLFRFGTAANPVSAAQFNAFARNLNSGTTAFFDDTSNEYAFSTGVSTGDGRQASHWRDDSLSGTFLGVMDPTLGFGQIFTVTSADWRAFDLIGYDIAPVAVGIAISEPSTLILAGPLLLVAGLVHSRRKRHTGA